MKRRVVFDTSSLVSAALRSGSIPHQALRRAFAVSDLCASETTLGELEDVLMEPKFDRYLDRPSRSAFVALLRRHTIHFQIADATTATVKPPCSDPKDNQFLAVAKAAEADAIISSDKDLLILNPWNRIAIVTPAEFLSGSWE